MKAIVLSLPADAVVTGEILSDYSGAPERLSSDILQVELPTGVAIHVGWYPRFDPSGCFRVVASNGDWDKPVFGPVRADDSFSAAKLVQEVAVQFSGPAAGSPSGASAFRTRTSLNRKN